MELITVNPDQTNGVIEITPEEIAVEPAHTVSTDKPFIQANTVSMDYRELKNKHIIPVYIKDNEPLISHADFVDATMQVASNIYSAELILKPSIRVSHPIKGRIPEAKNKPAVELLDHERTLYYERMAFIIELPGISDVVDGNTLSLTIGGIKAYNLDNLYNKKGSDEHFKIFIGFKNTVCCNLCIWTDGFSSNLKVTNINQLQACIYSMLSSYNAAFHLHELKLLNNYSITEQQFAHIIGRCRMYQHLPKAQQNDIQELMFGDTQLGTICKDFYKDKSFCRDTTGNISLWKLYNLFTGANKSTYIDHFIEKSVNAFQFAEQLRWTLENKTQSWFLN
jgi:hypothetical protein